MDITEAIQEAELDAAEEAALDDLQDADVISDYQTQGACHHE
jgi:hypothetical protein